MAVPPGRRLVLEKPQLPEPHGVRGPTGAWAQRLQTTLALYLTNVAFRLNRCLLRDGTVRFTGPTLLKVYTTSTRPAAASANEGAIIFVSDGSAGNKFQGSTGSTWLGLG